MKSKQLFISNNTVYKILNVAERKFQLAKKGTIERHLKNDNLEKYLVDYIEYNLTVRNKSENFNRVFVLTEQEYNDYKSKQK